MTRIGKMTIKIPPEVTVTYSKEDSRVTVKGPKGELVRDIDAEFDVVIESNKLNVKRPTDQKRHKSMHGLFRALIWNMIEGVRSGYKKELELIGVGYKATAQANILELSLGYSHNIFFVIPGELKVQAIQEKGSNPTIVLEGIDKQLVGQVASKIRSLRKVEPYKGKGIRYVGEYVRRKAGKAAAKA